MTPERRDAIASFREYLARDLYVGVMLAPGPDGGLDKKLLAAECVRSADALIEALWLIEPVKVDG